MRLPFPQFGFIYRKMQPPKPGNTNFLLEHSDPEAFLDVQLLLKSFHWNDLKSRVWFTFQSEFPETFVNGKSFHLPFHSGGAIMVGCIRRLGWSEPNGISLFIHLFLTLTSRIDASQKCIGSVTKDSFVSLVTNLKNKNNNCKQWCLLLQIETDESLTIWQWVLHPDFSVKWKALKVLLRTQVLLGIFDG